MFDFPLQNFKSGVTFLFLDLQFVHLFIFSYTQEYYMNFLLTDKFLFIIMVFITNIMYIFISNIVINVFLTHIPIYFHMRTLLIVIL